MAEELIGWAVSALVVLVVVAFIVYLFAVARLPDERPRVSTYDRHGKLIGRYENPGEQIAPGRRGDPRAQRKEHGG
ncbi:hypothetical protein [Sinomonas terrae]|uniref:Uncharacterized protein n=1 Tax=Sinomonas terrae TaxID=2908838 RepID=A0ABS9TW41_9MICC|nr:hypothetical protein [Sinomonas terrae]MCH6468639.1 hypothetical protein [Sinomonas terrae]